MVLNRVAKGYLTGRSGQDDMAGGFLSDAGFFVLGLGFGFGLGFFFFSYPDPILLLCNNVGLEKKRKKIHLDYYLHISETLLQAAWRLLDNFAPSPGFLYNAYKIFFLKPDSEAQISSAHQPLQPSPHLKSQ